MKTTLLAAALCVATVCSVSALAQTDTTFTYEGELQEAGAPANGSFTLDFSLFDALIGGAQVGSTVTIAAQAVSDGLFSSPLDFGVQDYSGTPYWLEIVVDGTTLSPRQAITATPYSIQTRGLFVDEGNKIGIGTSSPLAELHVVADELSQSLDAIHGAKTGIGTGYGVRGSSESSVGGIGVIGEASASTGNNYGGLFQSWSTSGRGVYGVARADTGITYGAYGKSESTGGRGVYGEATASTGETYGGWFESNSSAGRGVFGKAAATTGTTYGGHFESWSTSGRGVYGRARASGGLTDGVFGQSDSTSGRGLCGWAPASSGTTYGVYGTSNSTSGRGVYGGTTATTGTTTGVWGANQSVTGRAVFGQSSATTGVNYGVFGTTGSTSGRGVFGEAAANTGINFGVRGQSNSPTGFDFYASGAGTNYGASSSRRWKNNVVNINNPLDKLASLRGVYFDWDDEHGGQHDLGMIAEEVGKVLPEIVNYEENGVDAIGMDYSKMTPLLVEAVNAMQAQRVAERAEMNVERAEKDAQIKELNDRIIKLERVVYVLLAKKE
jgi:Chaperone of endosialidase